MSETMAPVPADHPMMKAWEAYKNTDDFRNSFKWAADVQHRTGSMWAAFVAGFEAATERAASLHESVNPASDMERHHGDPGAGAMGAVIEYRDTIRAPRLTANQGKAFEIAGAKMSRADQDRELLRNVSEREAKIADAAQRLAWEKAADWLSQKQVKAEQYPGGDRAIQKGRALAYQNAAQELYGWVIESDMAVAD